MFTKAEGSEGVTRDSSFTGSTELTFELFQGLQVTIHHVTLKCFTTAFEVHTPYFSHHCKKQTPEPVDF